MTVPNPEDTGSQPQIAELMEKLGATSWRARKRAVERLSRENSEELALQVVEILRHAHRDLSVSNAAIQILIHTETDVVPVLLRLFTNENTDRDLRAYIALTLGERGDPRAITALISALSDADTNVRVYAIEALGKLRASAAVDPLVELVDSKAFEVAMPALDALAAIGDRRIADRLLPLLRNSLFKTTAVETLGALGNTESIKSLLELFGDAEISPRTIARAIRQIYQWHFRLFGSGDEIVAIVQQNTGPETVAVLSSDLPISSPLEATAIVFILGAIQGLEAEDTLFECLANTDLRPDVIEGLAHRGSEIISGILKRLEVTNKEHLPPLIELCGRVGDHRCATFLLGLLPNDDDDVVVATLQALTRMGDARLYPIAKSFLGHSETQIRCAAIDAMHSHRHLNTASELNLLLHDNSALVRESAVELAARLGLPGCNESILACANDHDERVRRAAIQQLPFIDDPRVLPCLKHAIESDTPLVRAAAATAFGEIDAGNALPLLDAALRDGDVWVRYYAVRAMSRADHRRQRAESLLSVAAEDPATQVRIAAVESLGGYGDAGIALLATLAENHEPDLANASLSALGATGSTKVIPSLLKALYSEALSTRLSSIRALAATNLEDAISPLLEVASLRDRRMAEEAITCLGCMKLAGAVDSLLLVAELPARREAVVSSFSQMGEKIVSRLACRLHIVSPDVRRLVVEVLSRIRTTEAIGVLETALDTSEPAVRHAVHTTLTPVRRVDERNWRNIEGA